MKASVQWRCARCAVIQIEDGGLYDTREAYQVFLNGAFWLRTEHAITTLFDLRPATAYCLRLADFEGKTLTELAFETPDEFVTLNVRAFGAKGDGMSEDTAAIQAAILACPSQSRVLIPAGEYPVTHLFLKSGLRLEIAAGARLLGIPDRTRIPTLPGMVDGTDDRSEYNLGTWEGNPLPMYASLLTGIDVADVVVYGQGIVYGRAETGDWWQDPKRLRGAWRPRLAFFNRCEEVAMVGLSLHSSPAWHVHPYFSRRIRLMDLSIASPADSPNTDGINPESCEDVLIAGVRFSVGDDCIAIKSGKRYMGDTYATPCRDVRVLHCDMGDGHGAVTLGSEMSGGIHDVRVERCVFHDTDRGLRIKTRRGRGRNAVIDNIVLRDIRMERVKSPVTVNCFYRCDPDGDASHVQDRGRLPLDDSTPRVRSLMMERVEARDCAVCAGYFLGLPESPIKAVLLRDVAISFAPDAQPGEPVMTAGIVPVARKGITAIHVDAMTLENVCIRGAAGLPVETEDVRALKIEGGVES